MYELLSITKIKSKEKIIGNLIMKNKQKKENKIIDVVMEFPKISFALLGIGFLIILYSFISLDNPFFLITGIFMGIVVISWGYEYWYKKLHDMKLQHIEQRVDYLQFPPLEK